LTQFTIESSIDLFYIFAESFERSLGIFPYPCRF